MPKVFMIQGASEVGKTTLIERLVSLSARDGLRTGIIKSCGHQISIDASALKDSAKFRAAGSERILLHQETESTLFAYHAMASITEMVLQYYSDLDHVFVEGFSWAADYPRIIVLRESIPPKPIHNTENLLAFVTDGSCKPPLEDYPIFNINDSQKIYSFLLQNAPQKDRCILSINGKTIAMNHFVEKVIINTLSGLCSSIHTEEEIMQQLELKIQLSSTKDNRQT